VTRVVCDSKQAVPIRATSASFVVVRAAVYRLTRSRETPRISQSHYGMAVLWSPHSTPGRYPAERGWGWSGRVSPLRRTPRWRWPVRWRCWESLPRQPTPDPSDPAGSHPIWEGHGIAVLAGDVGQRPVVVQRAAERLRPRRAPAPRHGAEKPRSSEAALGRTPRNGFGRSIARFGRHPPMATRDHLHRVIALNQTNKTGNASPASFDTPYGPVDC